MTVNIHSNIITIVIITVLSTFGEPARRTSRSRRSPGASPGRRPRRDVCMCARVCVCIYIYIYICVSLSIYIYIYRERYAYVYGMLSIGMCIYIYIYTHIRTYAHIHYIYIYIYIYGVCFIQRHMSVSYAVKQ